MAPRARGPDRVPMTRAQRRVVVASSLGAAFEWYDFFLFGTMAATLGQRFFARQDEASAFLAALLVFAAGYLMRPVGALLFGRLGDRVGRRSTFFVTLLVMSLATFLVGVLPGHDAIGVAAPVVLVALRLLQGLALGGESGGAITLVAEHAPAGRRGAVTAWVQASVALGLMLALLVPLAVRALLGDAAFDDWGWRVPFLLAAVWMLPGIALRMAMDESPAYRRLQARGRTSSAPLSESFGHRGNLRLVLLALFGLVAGQAVVGMTGQFLALFHLRQVLGLGEAATAGMMAAALVVGGPLIVAFGHLADCVGRKPVILAGLALACVGTVPLFGALTRVAHPELARAQAAAVIVVHADPARCALLGLPWADARGAATGCDIARRALSRHGAPFAIEHAAPGAPTVLRLGGRELAVPDTVRAAGGPHADEASGRAVAAFQQDLARALAAMDFPAQAPVIDTLGPRWWSLVGLLSALLALVAMVHGPIAAMLVEMFPTRIRYSSVSLPYHLGNGVFGGLLPVLVFAVAVTQGQALAGLWFTVGAAGLSLLVCGLLLRETLGDDIHARD